MSFSELFSSSFLFSIGIIVVLIGVVFAYMSYRITDQDHKISSMVSLVSTMAEELQFFRNKLSSSNFSHSTQQMQINPLYNAPNFHGGNNLIEVSDDDDNDDVTTDEEGSDIDTVERSEEESENDSESESESESESDDDDNIKSIRLDEEQLHDNEVELGANDVDDIIDLSTLPIPHIDEEKQVSHNIVINDNEDLNLKSISISEETHDDFKKMSLQKLRNLVTEKGLVSDASKLKKGELLKLLEDE